MLFCCLSRPSRATGAAVVSAVVATAAPATAQFDALPFITVNIDNDPNLQTDVPTETDYVPRVVASENGLASFEALKAQAVAARTFGYYKMDLNGFIGDGQNDQVYSGINPSRIHRAAADATEGEILYIRDTVGFERDVLIASFYVAGAIPTAPFDPANPSARPEPGAPSLGNTERFVTYTYEAGLFGNDNRGSTLGFIPDNPRSEANWPNRGAKSQNGADYLSDNSINYLDILKYYYGADIQVRTAGTAGTGVSFGYKTLTNFDDYGSGRTSDGTIEGHEGVFNRAPDFSGSTTANVAGSTADRTDAEAFSGSSSQLIDISYDETQGGTFLLRHVAGAKFSDFGGSTNAASSVANLQFNAAGSVGFYLKTDDPGLQVSLALDDPGTADRGLLQDVIADNQWHRYEWFIDDPNFWVPWLAGGNGQIDGDRVSLDSIQLFGSTDAQVYLDEVFWDPTAVFTPLAGDYNLSGQVEQGDLDLVLQNWGDDTDATGVPLGWLADLPEGQIEQTELDKVLTNWGSTNAPNFNGSTVPEPAALTLIALSGLLARRRR